MALIGGAFSVVESQRFLLLPLPLSGIRTNPRLLKFGFECAGVVGGRGDSEPGVGAVEDANRVDENGSRVFEPVHAGVQKRR